MTGKNARAMLDTIMRETNLSLTQIATKAGLASSTLTRFHNKEVKHTLSSRTIEKLSQAFPEASCFVQSGQYNQSSAAGPRVSENTSKYRSHDAPADVPVYRTGLRKLVLGIDMGLLEAQPVGYFTRPKNLIGRDYIYAIHVDSNKMEPRYKRGDPLYIDPLRPPVEGDDIVIKITDEEGTFTAMRTLTKFGNDTIEITQYNPKKTTVVKIQNIQAIERIIQLTELLGL